MTSRHISPATLTCGVLLAMGLTGCVVAPAGGHRAGYPVYSEPANEPIVYGAAPPPMRVEVMPALPYPGAVWINGFWGWNGGRHEWVNGHYARPVPGHRFVPHRWENAHGRWGLRGGFWAR